MMAIAHVNVVAAGASGTTVAWFTLAGALGGVLITGLISLATLMLSHRWQSAGAERQRLQNHNTLVRQERRESYAAYWRAWNHFAQQLRMLKDEIQALPAGGMVNRHPMPSLGAAKVEQLQNLIEKTWETEMEWRTAADALFLIADPQVEFAANGHIAMTEQKLAAAWEGTSHHDENGAAYHALNDAMRAALLTPVSPEAWVQPAH